MSSGDTSGLFGVSPDFFVVGGGGGGGGATTVEPLVAGLGVVVGAFGVGVVVGFGAVAGF